MGRVHWSVPGWISRLCLRVSARPVPQGVLPGGPRCVLNLRLSSALSRVLHCPLLGFSVASPALARGLGFSFVPYPLFCRLGLVPRSLAQLSRLFLCWRPCRSRSLIPSLAPSWWWPCPLLRWALLTLSGYVLGVPSAVSLRRSRC